MSNQVKLSSRLAADERTNGLDSLAELLRDEPHTVIACITWLTVQKVTEDVETGEKVPTVLIKRVEPIGAVDKVPAEVQKLAAELYDRRLGKGTLPLPFDVVETVEGGYVMSGDDE